MKYKLVIFDFDGTLANSMPWVKTIINQVADTFRFRRIESEEIELLRRSDTRQILRRLEMPLWKMPFIAWHLRRKMARESHLVPRFEGVDRLLARLAQSGARLAILTSNSCANVQTVLGEELIRLFTDLECNASTFGKPARIRKILKRAGLPPQQAIMIGDEVRDCLAARQVQIDFGAVAWGYNHLDAILPHAPSLVFHSVDEIYEKISQ